MCYNRIQQDMGFSFIFGASEEKKIKEHDFPFHLHRKKQIQLPKFNWLNQFGVDF